MKWTRASVLVATVSCCAAAQAEPIRLICNNPTTKILFSVAVYTDDQRVVVNGNVETSDVTVGPDLIFYSVQGDNGAYRHKLNRVTGQMTVSDPAGKTMQLGCEATTLKF